MTNEGKQMNQLLKFLDQKDLEVKEIKEIDLGDLKVRINDETSKLIERGKFKL